MAESTIDFSRASEDENHLCRATSAKILPISSTSMRKAINSLCDQHTIEEMNEEMSTKFVHRLGLDELYSPHVWRASAAELLGTAFLVFMTDTIVISSFESDIKPPNIVISCFIALLITILRLATVSVSGGHLNPTITLSAALTGLVSFSHATIYIMAQCIGSVLGAYALELVISNSISNNFSLGGCTLTIIAPGPNGPTTVGIETGRALWLEIFCTFFFLFPVSLGFDRRQVKALGQVVVCSMIGIVVGLIVFVSTSVTTKRGFSGVAVNPARCIGPAIVRGGHLWAGHWVFWVGPMIACIAFYLYTLIIPREHFKPRVNE